MSTIFMQYIFHTKALSFVSDSNRILAVAVAISTFLWLKNLNISYNKIINAIGGSTFGVLLIHANSDAMRQWLGKIPWIVLAITAFRFRRLFYSV